MEISQTLITIVQNLQDAGCSPDFIERFLELQANGRRERQLGLLSEHRCRLLDQVHESQKKLDCLDYLIYKMRKESGDSTARG